MPAATAAAGTEITVTTVFDASNGDVSSVESLLANPGPDGTSLREATLAGFTHGVLIEPYWQWTAGGSLPTQLTLANNVVDGLVMREVAWGIKVRSVFSPSCGAPRPERCWSYTTWKNTTITGNRIETVGTGIKFALNNAGDRVDRAGDPHNGGIVLLGGGAFGRAGAIRDVRITNNRIATTLTGIKLAGGFSPTARGNTVSCVRLAGNRIAGARSAVSVLTNLGKGTSGNRATFGGF